MSCDCASGFIKLAEENLPNAHISVDEFHVLRMLSKALEAVRLEERLRKTCQANLLEARLNKSPKKVIQHHRDRLLKLGMTEEEIEAQLNGLGKDDVERLRQEASSIARTNWCFAFGLKQLSQIASKTQQLGTILSNERLAKLLQLSDLCRDFWHCSYSPAQVRQYILEWIELAKSVGSVALEKFCSFLLKHLKYIIYAPMLDLSNSVVEGLNSSAKAYQRTIRGVKDLAHYMLKMHKLYSENRGSRAAPRYFGPDDYDPAWDAVDEGAAEATA